jgi:manganese/zinc/iron transport system substrate-binding protein
MRRRSFFVLVIGFIVLVLPGCSERQAANANRRLQLVATTGMLADALQNIAGDKADVIAIMGPGVDPHLYKATQGDLEKLRNADMVFYNGLHLEGKMGEVLEKLGRTKPVIAVGERLPETDLRKAAGFAGAYDPHIWFDVQLWRSAVGQMRLALQQQDTLHRDWYAQNEKRYAQELAALNDTVLKRIQSIPQPQRVLVTAHDAFGYFGRRYGIEVRGLQGISTTAEFGLRDVEDLVRFISERKIKAIFVESSVSPKSIEAVVEGCKARGHAVRIGGTLYSDAMGKPGTAAGTYTGMVTANVNTIVEALK